MSKKIFIDCGANLGQSIDNFIKHWPDWQDYTILSFEAKARLKEYSNLLVHYDTYNHYNFL